jgi:hypothetical protein
MKTTIKNKPRTGLQKRIIMFISYLFLILFLEFSFMRLILKEGSLRLAEIMKTNLMIYNDNKIFIYTIYFLNSKWTLVFICGILLNFSTVYKLFIFVQNIFIAFYLIALMQILTRDELVYYNINFNISECLAIFGTPSFVSTITTIGALTLREIGLIQGESQNSKKTNLIITIGTWIYIILISILNFFSFINSLDQIIFGILIGLGIHILVFYLLETNIKKGKYLLLLIKKNFFIHVLFVFIPFIIFIIFYFSLLPNENLDYIINKKLIISDCPIQEKLDMFFQQNNFSIIIVSMTLFYLLIILYLRLEQNYNFSKKENDWINYNFNNEKNSQVEESFFSDISIGDNDTRWNKTKINHSFIRLSITYFFCFGILLIFHFFEIKTENLFLFILGNVFLPYGIIFSFLFYFSKILFKKIFLSNEYVVILSV